MAATPTVAPSTTRTRVAPAWLAPAAVGVAAVGACTVAGLTDSSDTWLPVCPMKAMTGIDCPGCGMTRSLRALTGGDLRLAADQNLLLVIALPLLVVGWALWLGRSLGLTQTRLLRWTPRTNAVVVGGFFAFWALRLLPFEPLGWLASGT